MGNKALTERQKANALRAKKNHQYNLAIEEYKRGQGLPPGQPKPGLQSVANKYPLITKGTLRNLVNGGQSIGAFNATKRKLSPSEERTMVNQILGSADRGLPQ